MRQARGIDSAFLAIETGDHPLHVMAVMILDPSTAPGGFSFEGFREFAADRLGGIPPFRQKLVPVPLGVARPRWVDVELDIDPTGPCDPEWYRDEFLAKRRNPAQPIRGELTKTLEGEATGRG